MKGKKWKIHRFNIVEVALALVLISMVVTVISAWVPLGTSALKDIRNETHIDVSVDMVNACMKDALLTGEINSIQTHSAARISEWGTEELWRIFQNVENGHQWHPVVSDVDGNVILSQTDSPLSGGKVFRFNSYTVVILDGERFEVLDFSAEIWTDVSATELEARYEVPIIVSWPASQPPERRTYRFVKSYIFCPNTTRNEK